ncbi:MAG: NAD-dependent succinate-semialdehyde dehydrogenase, partial [Nitriliruptoraceae bacterium]
MSGDVLTGLDTRLRIGGELRPASDGAEFPVLDPATGGTIASVASGTAEDAVAAVAAPPPGGAAR